MKIGVELIMCIQLYEWIKNNTDLKYSYYHFPLEGKRNYQNAQFLNKMGMIAGVHDIFISRTTVQKKKGLWIEVKEAGKKPTKIQREFGDRMIQDGFDVYYGDNVDAIKLKIEQCYFKNSFFKDGFDIPVNQE